MHREREHSAMKLRQVVDLRAKEGGREHGAAGLQKEKEGATVLRVGHEGQEGGR